ncbi:major Facilitator Superfamily protein, partial [Vibrio parahaemolyticus AQ3810]
ATTWWMCLKRHLKHRIRLL